MITSSPFFQFIGVATLCFAVRLERIDHAQHLIEIAAGGHRIDQDQFDLLVRANDEDVPYG
jgi:hypothetical protein